MDKWLAGLIIVAVGLPLLMFIGNLKTEGLEGGEAGSISSSEHGLQEFPPTPVEINLSYPPEVSNSNEKNE